MYIFLQMENIFIEKTTYLIFILISPLFFSRLMFMTSYYLGMTFMWDKVFNNGSSKIFKGCLPQILLDPFLILFPFILADFRCFRASVNEDLAKIKIVTKPFQIFVVPQKFLKVFMVCIPCGTNTWSK